MKKSIRLVSILLSILMVMSVFSVMPAFAAESSVSSAGGVFSSGTTGDCNWEIRDDGWLIISSNKSGARMADYASDDNSGYKRFPEQIKWIYVDKNVEYVGKYAFHGLTTASFFNCEDVVEIGNNAFENCTSLTNALMPLSLRKIGNYAFFNCTSLTKVDLLYGVKNIGDRAFEHTGLEYICVPRSVVSIGEKALGYRVANLSEIKTNLRFYSGSQAVINYASANGFSCVGSLSGQCIDEATSYNLDLETGNFLISGQGSMGVYNDDLAGRERPWRYCLGAIESVELYDTVADLSDISFKDCRGLTSVKLGTFTEKIGSECFYNCKALKSVDLPGAEEIGEMAFYNCVSLSTVTLHEGLKTINKSSFENTALTEITIPESLTGLGEYSLAYKASGDNHTAYPFVIKSVKNDVAQKYARRTGIEFKFIDAVGKAGGCVYTVNIGTGLLTLKSDSTTVIPDYEMVLEGGKNYSDAPWMRYKDNIKNLKIESGITQIGKSAFEGLEYLTELTVPDTVVNICYMAFSYCTGLQSVSIEGKNCVIGERAFFCSDFPVININGAESIGDYAFAINGKIEEIVVPKGCKKVGDKAFSGCPKLQSVSFQDTATEIYDSTYTIPNSVKILCYWKSSAEAYAKKYNKTYELFDPPVTEGESNECAWKYDLDTNTLTISGSGEMADYEKAEDAPWYRYRAEMKKIVVEENVTKIGKNAFYGTSITSFTAPASLKEIGDSAFNYNTLLESVDLVNVEKVGSGAFGLCTKLNKVTMSKVKELGALVFFFDAALTGEVTLPRTCTNALGAFTWTAVSKLTVLNKNCVLEGEIGTTTYADDAVPSTAVIRGYEGSTAEAYATKYNRTFEKLDPIETSGSSDSCSWSFDEESLTLTVSGSDAMADYEKDSDTPWYNYRGEISKVVIGEGVTKIGKNAFYGTSITEFVAPDSLKEIGESAFCLCGNLERIDLKNVEKVGTTAFCLCTKLNSVTMTKVKTLGDGAFSFDTSLTGEITLPESCENAIAAFAITPLSKLTVLNKNCALEGTVGTTTYSENAIMSSVVISGYEGSTAQDYALKYNRTFESLGDEPQTQPTAPSDVTAPTAPSDTNPGVSVPTATDPSAITTRNADNGSAVKKANPIKVKVRKKAIVAKASKLRKKKRVIKNAIKVKNAKGKVTFQIVKKGTSAKIFKKLKISKKGFITLKKGKYAKKLYKVKIMVTAAGNNAYNSASRTVTIKIKVK